MFPRRHRLLKRDNIPDILKHGKMEMNRLAVARFRSNKVNRHRFSVIVSHKIHGKATKRNRIRRQMRAAVRQHMSQLPTDQHFDILFLPKKAILNRPYCEIENALLSLISKVK